MPGRGPVPDPGVNYYDTACRGRDRPSSLRCLPKHNPGCLQFSSPARRNFHIMLKNWMVSASSEDIRKTERLWKSPYELQYPFCFMGRILITVLLKTVTLSSDAVPFSSVTICPTLSMYLLEAWTERPGHISECYFTGGRMFWTVTWFEWGWWWQQDVAASLLLFAHSHVITSNAYTFPRHTRISYFYRVLKGILNAVHLYRNYGQL